MENDQATPSKNAPDRKSAPERVGHLKHGVPPDAAREEPMGTPNSDRHKVETNPTQQ
jgi:hypothetical protein